MGEREVGQYHDNSMGITVNVLLATTVGLAAWYILRRRSSPRNLPPGPPAIPVLGSLPFIGMADKEGHLSMARVAKKYGDIFHFWLGHKSTVALNSYDVIREALVENAAAMAGRPNWEIPGYANDKGIVDPTYTAQWKHDRNISLSILKEFGFGKTVMGDRILEEVEATLTHLDQLCDTPFDPSHVMQVSVSNVICSIVLGKQFKHDDTEFLGMLGVMDDFMDASGAIADSEFIPILRLLPSQKSAIKRFVGGNDRLVEYLMTFISQHKKCHLTGDTSDFIHDYLERTGGETDDESFAWIVRDLFIAGTETTSSMLRWAFVYMANYPDIQKKVQEELGTVLQKGRLPSLGDKSELPYTEAVILELQRLAAVAPQGIPHETLDDVTLSGYLIPKGTMILANLWAVLRDPKLWPEPDKMKPERFLTEDGKVLHRPELITFSLGRRACLGEIMARQEMFLFFAAILHNYSIERPGGVDKIDESGRSMFTRVPSSYEIIIRKRQ